MDKIYIFGGFVVTGGTLDDGKPWQGFRLLLAELKPGQTKPMTAISAKGVYSDSLAGTLSRLPLGSRVKIAACDLRGRVVDIQPVKA